MTARQKPNLWQANLWQEWRRWWVTVAFVDALFSRRQTGVSTHHR
jgi:hypothetical protein